MIKQRPETAPRITVAQVHTWYPENDWGDYTPLLHGLGHLVVRQDEEDYQGDTLALYRREEEWGILRVGWGSCSGCDALQGCRSPRAVATLATDLARAIRWGSPADTRHYLLTHDWAGDAINQDLVRRFQAQALAVLAGQAPTHRMDFWECRHCAHGFWGPISRLTDPRPEDFVRCPQCGNHRPWW